MERCALFVDAGYVVASVGSLCLGTEVTAEVVCDFGGLADALDGYVTADSGLPLLRSYWYSAASSPAPPAPLRGLVGRPRTKLRLGVLTQSQQKETDLLLHDDLVQLAAGGHVATAFLLSGDADFRLTVAKAQAHGVEVALIEIPIGRTAQSLIREADRRVVLEPDFWRPHFRRRGLNGSRQAADAGAGDSDGYALAARQAGADFARSWLRRVGTEESDRLRAQGHWGLPQQLDGALMRYAKEAADVQRDSPDLRLAVRAGFWGVLSEAD
jgi:hypothetical protein